MTLDLASAGSARRRGVPGPIVIGASILVAWIVLATFASFATNYDPDIVDLGALLAPPSSSHWFGTDDVGRDVFARVVFGARIDLWMGFAGVVLPMVIGTTVGLCGGYFGGLADAFLMRLVDITVAFPFFVLVLAIIAVLGPGLINYFVALAFVDWVAYARLVRAEVLVIKSSDYISAARSLGYSRRHILMRHVLPNALSPVLVYALTDAVLVILGGASLGFLGMGVQPPTAEWGVMIAAGQPYMVEAWWICLFPGIAAVSLGLGLSLIGDGLARWRRSRG